MQRDVVQFFHDRQRHEHAAVQGADVIGQVVGAGLLLQDMYLAIAERLHAGSFIDLVFETLFGDSQAGCRTVLSARVVVGHLGHHFAATS
ncbi:hypothetical protein D9M68_981640 [compost metagenome]